LKRRVKDQRFLEILGLLFKAGEILPSGIEFLRIQKGNSLSRIFSNIYFHEFDIFVENKIIYRYFKGLKATKWLDYNKDVGLTTKNNIFIENKRSKKKKHKSHEHTHTNCYTKMDDTFIRVNYLRYADNFLLGLRCPKYIVLKIKCTLEFFMKSQLRLKLLEQKIKVFDSFSTKVPFLGMLIHNVPGMFSKWATV
jgi:hypothetical protein